MNNVLVCKSNLRHDFITGKNKLPYFSGPTYLDNGYIFAPYTPMITTEDVESELIILLSEQVAAEIDREILENIVTLSDGQDITLINENTQHENGFDTTRLPVIRQVHPRLLALDIVPVQPMELPTIDIQYFTTNLEQEVESEMGKITWRTDETWSYENLYGSKIGIKMELRPHDFIKKYRSVFETHNTFEVTYDGVPEPGNRYENINRLIYREFNTY